MKRLFFGLQIEAPWPEKLPSGRVLDESNRHMTLAFLGPREEMPPLPKFNLKIGFVGQFDQCLILPHVVAWHVHWLSDVSALENLFSLGKNFLPHVTLCRKPFSPEEWLNAFVPLPMMATSIHLYESLGNSCYSSCWNYPLLLPFEEIEHTADIAFLIRGENLLQIYQNAQIALAFKFPPLLAYCNKIPSVHSLDEIIMLLNDLIGKADAVLGCPFKAISFHGEIKEDEYLTWEMIVDV